MSSHSFEKPGGWGIAPQSSWVSGQPIDQSGIKMPNLGDPGEEPSSRVSFGDEENPLGEGAMFRGRKVTQCPAGMKNEKGMCVNDPNSQAKPESRFRAMTGHQWDREPGESKKPGEVDPSLKRDLPEAPMAGVKTKKISLR